MLRIGRWALAAAFLIATGEVAAAVTITIDLSQQTMTVVSGAARSTYEWKVSTARRGYVTPLGSYRPQFLKRMHYSSRYHNSPMPHSIFFKGNFAIHGTNYIKSLGKPASHGCVRLHPTNARLLFNLVRQEGMENTTITIVP